MTPQVVLFHEESNFKLTTQYDKCPNNSGNYVEKWFKVYKLSCKNTFKKIILNIVYKNGTYFLDMPLT